jgi:hypothetical protein
LVGAYSALVKRHLSLGPSRFPVGP